MLTFRSLFLSSFVPFLLLLLLILFINIIRILIITLLLLLFLLEKIPSINRAFLYPCGTGEELVGAHDGGGRARSIGWCRGSAPFEPSVKEEEQEG